MNFPYACETLNYCDRGDDEDKEDGSLWYLAEFSRRNTMGCYDFV